MTRIRRVMLPAIAFLLLTFAPSAFSQDATAIWTALTQPAFDPAKTARLENVTVSRDRMKLTFADGTIQFSKPVNGVVFGAVFSGRGRVQIAPPNTMEAQQLANFTGQRILDMEWTEAIITFSDGLMEEVAANARWTESAAVYSDPYSNRQREREDVSAELLPRLFKSVLSADRKRTALFAADLRTKDKGWIHVRFDALSPEEITVGRWMNWGGATLFDTWMSFPAGDRTSAAAYHVPMEREETLIRGYVIDVSISNAAELTAVTKMNFTHRAAGERAVVFQLDANLRLTAVNDEKGQALQFFQPRDPKDRNQSYGDYVAVVLPQPSTAGVAQVLEFHYGGKRVVRKEGNGNFFCQSYGWYPTIENSFATRADFEIHFKTPKRYTLVATGSKVDETTDGDWTVSTWKSDIPLAVAGFAFGDYKVVTESAGPIEVAIYANREGDSSLQGVQRAVEGGSIPQLGGNRGGFGAVGELTPVRLAKPMAIEMANTLRVFEKYFGPYPFKRLAVSSLPLSYSYGQGWPNLIYLWSLSFLDSQQRHTLGVVDHTGLTDFFRAHEASHQWWGHRVGWKSYHDQWLSEGFAQFSGNLYVQFRQGEKEYLNRLRLDKQDLRAGDLKNRAYESVGPVWMGRRLASSEGPRTYSVVIYNKGGYVLHMIRMLMLNARSQEQDERFIAMMREFCQTYDNKPASTEDFKALVEKHMLPFMDIEGNRKMDWFFRQYVYGTGIPEYEFKYTLTDAAEGKTQLIGTVTRLGGPEQWKDLLPIYMQSGGRNLRLGFVTIRERVTPINVTLPSRPEKLILNANEDMLVEVKQ